MGAQSWPLSDLLGRSTDKDFSETTLFSVLCHLPALGADGPWLAGGALRRTLLGQEPDSDFDFFFRDAEQMARFAADMEVMGLREAKKTEHHIQFRGAVGDSKIERDFQLINFAYYNSAEDVINSFDFTICQFAYDGDLLTSGEFSLWDLGRKRLAVNKITFPVSTMRRLLKYAHQGFNACPGALAAILRETATRPDLLQRLDIQYVD